MNASQMAKDPAHTLTGPPDSGRVGRVLCVGEGCPVCQLFYDPQVFNFEEIDIEENGA